jgi:hypothetical protein
MTQEQQQRTAATDVLRLLDARTQTLVSVRSALLRVCVHASTGDGPRGLGDLRVLLVADVLLRVAELRGTQVMVALALTDLDPHESTALEYDAGAFGIYPAAGRSSGHDVVPWLGGPPDLHVAGRRTASAGNDTGGVLLQVGAVQASRDEPDSLRRPRSPSALTPHDIDPLAVRLALLNQSYARRVAIGSEVLLEAAATLRRWRRRVAQWAEAPSRPMPPEAIVTAFAALHDNLDTPSMLAVLARLEGAQHVPAGAKFETFVHLDRVLGVDLARGLATCGDDP